MNISTNQRKHRRVLAVCQIVDENNNLIGFTLDLTVEGIRLIVPQKFKDQPEFSVTLRGKDIQDETEVNVRIQKKWRQPRDEEFDEIGGILIYIDSKNKFNELLSYFSENAKIYDFDP